METKCTSRWCSALAVAIERLGAAHDDVDFTVRSLELPVLVGADSVGIWVWLFMMLLSALVIAVITSAVVAVITIITVAVMVVTIIMATVMIVMVAVIMIVTVMVATVITVIVVAFVVAVVIPASHCSEVACTPPGHQALS